MKFPEVQAVLDKLPVSVQGKILDRGMGLPPAIDRNVKITRDIMVTMPDGVQLSGDLYQPSGGTIEAPTVMSRTPYAKVGMASRTTALPFAQRGFNVFIQAVRGTHGGSGGVLDPFLNEEKDGLATLDWLEEQPWFNGQLFTFGPSYVGATQALLAVSAGNRITGGLPMIAPTSMDKVLFSGGVLHTALAIQWVRRMHLLEAHSASAADLTELTYDWIAQRGMSTLPLRDADKVVTGHSVPYFQSWVDSADDPAHPYREEMRAVTERAELITAPVHFYGGWHDFALPSYVDSYLELRELSRDPFLTISYHAHVDPETMAGGFREGYEWFSALAKGEPLREYPVKLWMQGIDEWRYFSEYPPREAKAATWQLQSDGVLDQQSVRKGANRKFRFDQSDPTPDFGGSLLNPNLSGRKKQNAREARSDVLVYTSAALTEPLEVAGPVSARIKLRTSGPYFDLFVRVCDVDENGVSTNVCDNIQRATPEENPADATGVRTVTVQLFPTANHFKAGHRLRIQVCGGSFPHFQRNAGTGAPVRDAVEQVPIDYEILPGSTVTLSTLPRA